MGRSHPPSEQLIPRRSGLRSRLRSNRITGSSIRKCDLCRAGVATRCFSPTPKPSFRPKALRRSAWLCRTPARQRLATRRLVSSRRPERSTISSATIPPSGARASSPTNVFSTQVGVSRDRSRGTTAARACTSTDLVVGPGADPSRIAMSITGADRIDLDSQTGNLQLVTASTTFTMRAPDVYQIVDGHRQTIAARYTLTDQSSVGFALDAYDASAPLVIDPQLIYGTFLGGTGNGVDQVSGLALGRDGSAVHRRLNRHHRLSRSRRRAAARRRLGRRGGDQALARWTAACLRDLSDLRHLIGGSNSDGATEIAIRSNGTAYIVGSTFSDDFPVRATAFQPRRAGGSDVFLLALAADGASITESTLLGGSDEDNPIGLEARVVQESAPGSERSEGLQSAIGSSCMERRSLPRVPNHRRGSSQSRWRAAMPS